MYYAMDTYKPEGMAYAIFCFGNPAVWYAGIAGIAYTVYRWLKNHRYRLADRPGTWHLCADTWSVTHAFVIIGLLAQFLPWVLVPRGTYIYHYFASVPFLILGTVLMLDALCRSKPRTGLVATVILLTISTAMFIVLFPYASGVLSPVAWMDMIRNYPWTGNYLMYNTNPLVEGISALMEAIPLIPNVW